LFEPPGLLMNINVSIASLSCKDFWLGVVRIASSGWLVRFGVRGAENWLLWLKSEADWPSNMGGLEFFGVSDRREACDDIAAEVISAGGAKEGCDEAGDVKFEGTVCLVLCSRQKDS
jgi:hypothetical protein